MLAVVGGHSFQDYAPYREAALAALPGLGLGSGEDVVLLGTLPDDDLPRLVPRADAFAFPSVKEGFGLVVLEALAAGRPPWWPTYRCSASTWLDTTPSSSSRGMIRTSPRSSTVSPTIPRSGRR